MEKILASIGEFFNYVIGAEMLIQWAQLIVLIVTAYFILKSVKAAETSVKETDRTMQAQLYVRLWEYYASKEMLEGLRLLKVIEGIDAFKRWKEEGPNTYGGAFNEGILSDNIKEIEKEEKDYRHYQRFVKYYFLRIYHLDEQGFLPNNLVKDLLSVDGIKLFFEVVKPLEYLANEKFVSTHVDALYKRAKKLHIKELPKKLWRFKK
jgi:hypothetical protein